MVDKSDFKVQFIKRENRGGHVEYLFKVVAPNNISFDLRDRYSNMRRFQRQIVESLNIRSLNGLPNFPPKKAFGNLAEDFLNTRQRGLENFFKFFFTNQDIQKSQQLQQYFLERAADSNSTAKVKELIDFNRKGKPSAVSQSQQQQKKPVEELKTSPIGGNVKPNPDNQVVQANIQMI